MCRRRSSATASVSMAPVIMGAACVACHNSHPESPKRDWKVGDVRGIQEITISQPIAVNLFSFKYLLAYFVFMAASGISFHRCAAAPGGDYLSGMNRELRLRMTSSRTLIDEDLALPFAANLQEHLQRPEGRDAFTPSARSSRSSSPTSRILPRRQSACSLSRSRRCSTSISPRCRTSRSSMAARLDKLRRRRHSDLLRRSGIKGEAEDAKACLHMAADMQHRLAELNVKWRNEGVEHPFRVRMGINTGYLQCRQFRQCRPRWTIRSSAPRRTWRRGCNRSPNRVTSLSATRPTPWCADILVAHALPPITMKGISREVVPYARSRGHSSVRWGRTVEIFGLSRRELGGVFYLSDPRAWSSVGLTPRESGIHPAIAESNQLRPDHSGRRPAASAQVINEGVSSACPTAADGPRISIRLFDVFDKKTDGE